MSAQILENKKIYEVSTKSPELIKSLVNIWEDSVRATHLFLTEDEVLRIREYIPQALANIAHLIVASHAPGKYWGFMGIEQHRLEMLFLADAARGKGLGAKLIAYAIQKYNVREVTVNEQNPQAVGFYQHMGFKTYKRTAVDEAGFPYPLLYMRL